MKVSELINSAKIEHGDLDGREVTLTIKRVDPPGSVKASDGSKIDKSVMFFEETPKYLVLNATNLRLARAALASNETDRWPGRSIILRPATTDIPRASAEKFGCIILRELSPKMVLVPCVRVKIEAEDDEP